jgi:hypothetical protein
MSKAHRYLKRQKEIEIEPTLVNTSILYKHIYTNIIEIKKIKKKWNCTNVITLAIMIIIKYLGKFKKTRKDLQYCRQTFAT